MQLLYLLYVLCLESLILLSFNIKFCHLNLQSPRYGIKIFILALDLDNVILQPVYLVAFILEALLIHCILLPTYHEILFELEYFGGSFFMGMLEFLESFWFLLLFLFPAVEFLSNRSDLFLDLLLFKFWGFEVFEEHVLRLVETLYFFVSLCLERD